MARYRREKGFSTRREKIKKQDGVVQGWTFSCIDGATQCPFKAEVRLIRVRRGGLWELKIHKDKHSHKMDPKAHRVQVVKYFATTRPNYLDYVQVRQQHSPVSPPAPRSLSMTIRTGLPRFTNGRYQVLGDYLEMLFKL